MPPGPELPTGTIVLMGDGEQEQSRAQGDQPVEGGSAVPDHGSQEAGSAQRPGKVLNLDEIERERTGDPLVDRGLDMTLSEMQEALADPEHPDHEAARAANRHLAERVGGMFSGAYREQVRRIGENLSAAVRPSLSDLFKQVAPQASAVRPPSLDILFEGAGGRSPRQGGQAWDDSDDAELELDDTPQRTLEAIVDLSEVMSQMVRVAAEHRDVAEAHRALAEKDAEAQRIEAAAARRRANLANWGTWLAMAGTWAAVIVTFVLASHSAR